MVTDVLNQNALCVYGNADRLTADKSLFNALVKTDGTDLPDRSAESGETEIV